MNFKNVFTKFSQVINLIIDFIYLVLVILSIIILSGFALDKIQKGPGNIFGYKPIIINTGSMYPSIHEKSVIIGKVVKNINDLKVDDVITYRLYEDGKDKLITHRIIDIDYETEYLKTKGDNNNVVDMFSDEKGLKFDNVVYRIDHIYNNLVPIISLILLRPFKLIYLGMILIGIFIIWKILNDEYYRDAYEFNLKRREEGR